jgi:hypothetical protein
MSEENKNIYTIQENYPQGDWECEMFGCGRSIVLYPLKKDVPNWFWRTMQYLILGNKWKKKCEN